MISLKSLILTLIAIQSNIFHTLTLQYVEVFRDDFTVPWAIDQSKWNIITAPSTVNEELHHYMFDDVWQGNVE